MVTLVQPFRRPHRHFALVSMVGRAIMMSLALLVSGGAWEQQWAVAMSVEVALFTLAAYLR